MKAQDFINYIKAVQERQNAVLKELDAIHDEYYWHFNEGSILNINAVSYNFYTGIHVDDDLFEALVKDTKIIPTIKDRNDDFYKYEYELNIDGITVFMLSKKLIDWKNVIEN